MKAEDVQNAIESGEIEIYAFLKRVFIRDKSGKGIEVKNQYGEMYYDPLSVMTAMERKKSYKTTFNNLGLCIYCGSADVGDGKKTCKKCARERAEVKRLKREEKKNEKRKCM